LTAVRVRNSMGTITHITTSRAFCIWRWFYTLILFLWTIQWFIFHSLDWSVVVGYYNLYFGFLPAAIFLLLKHTVSRWACWFVCAYDILVSLALVVALILLPNYMLLGFLLPLAGFIFEGGVLAFMLIHNRHNTSFSSQDNTMK